MAVNEPPEMSKEEWQVFAPFRSNLDFYTREVEKISAELATAITSHKATRERLEQTLEQAIRHRDLHYEALKLLEPLKDRAVSR